MLTPREFGLPAKFDAWRPGQADAIMETLNSDKRFNAVCAPTGWGKSLYYMAMAKMSGLRGVVCTMTKGLQDQLARDFGEISTDIRGQSNYPCIAAAEFGVPGNVTVEIAPCKGGAPCGYKDNGMCEYFALYRRAQAADLVVANYAMWLYDAYRDKEKGLCALRPAELLILDEAHEAPEALASFIGTELYRQEVRHAKLEWPDGGSDADMIERFKGWATESLGVIRERLDRHAETIKRGQGTSQIYREAAEWKRIERKITKVARIKGEWVAEQTKIMEGWRAGDLCARFDPLWPALYAESALFRGAKKVILVSATVRPKTLELLGIGAEKSNFREFPSSFPLASRPVIHVPTVQLNHRSTDFALMQWIEMIDRLIDARLDRKGVVHTVSYSRAKLLAANSRHSSMMLLHDSRTRAERVNNFKLSSRPSILVSPSVDTGYDFSYTECEYQIIAKVPFPDSRAKIMEARCKADKGYANYIVAQTLVQMTGRGMRAEDDKCETLIVDDNVTWWRGQNKQHLPNWWNQSYREMARYTMPTPLEKL